MTLVFIPGNPPQYQFNSSDLTSGSFFTGGSVSYIGGIGYNLDTGDFYRVISKDTVSKLPQQVNIGPDLAINASNLTLVLSGSKASAPILNASRILGVYTSSSTVRVGLEWPSTTTGSSSGSAAVSGDWQLGALVSQSEWNWYNIGFGLSRTAYFMSGSPADTVKLIQM